MLAGFQPGWPDLSRPGHDGPDQGGLSSSITVTKFLPPANAHNRNRITRYKIERLSLAGQRLAPDAADTRVRIADGFWPGQCAFHDPQPTITAYFGV